MHRDPNEVTHLPQHPNPYERHERALAWLEGFARQALFMGYHHYDRMHGDVHLAGQSPLAVQINDPAIFDVFTILGWTIPANEFDARQRSGFCLWCGEPYDEDPGLPHFHQRCLAVMSANEEAERPIREAAERARRPPGITPLPTIVSEDSEGRGTTYRWRRADGTLDYHELRERPE